MKTTHLPFETLGKLMEELLAKGVIDLKAAEATAEHTEVLAAGGGPVLKPFFRDLLLLPPVDAHETPRPDWVTLAVLRVQVSLFTSALSAKPKEFVENLGSLGGLALNFNQTPLPFENPTAEVAASWEALTEQVNQGIQTAQAGANRLPPRQRRKFYAGFAKGTARAPLEDELNIIGPYAALYLVSIWGWREIVALRSRREFLAWLERKSSGAVQAPGRRQAGGTLLRGDRPEVQRSWPAKQRREAASAEANCQTPCEKAARQAEARQKNTQS